MTISMAWRVASHLSSTEGTRRAWGIILLDAREGYAKVEMKIRDDMLNGHRTAHGGIIFALADTAFAYACNSRNLATVAQQASIHFLSSAKEGEVLVAEAQENALAGRSGSYTVAVRTEDGREVAQFQGLSRSVGGQVIDQKEGADD